MVARNRELIDQQQTVRNHIKALKDEKSHARFRLNQYKTNVHIQSAYKTKLLALVQDRHEVLNTNMQKNRISDAKVRKQIEKLRLEYEQQVQSLRLSYNCDEKANDICTYIDRYYQAEKKLREHYLGHSANSFLWPVSPRE